MTRENYMETGNWPSPPPPREHDWASGFPWIGNMVIGTRGEPHSYPVVVIGELGKHFLFAPIYEPILMGDLQWQKPGEVSAIEKRFITPAGRSAMEQKEGK